MLVNNQTITKAQLLTAIIQVNLLVMYKTKHGAMYVPYIKNIGDNVITEAVFHLSSEQPMKPFDGNWTISGNMAICDIGTLNPNQERTFAINIIGDISSAILFTTTNPPLANPQSGMAQASYQKQT